MAYTYNGQTKGTGLAFNITRGNPIPLDSWSLFMTLSEAETYAKSNPVSYPGQIITVIGDGTPNAYVIAAGTVAEGVEDTSTRRLVQLGQQSESGADIYWLGSNGQAIDPTQNP